MREIESGKLRPEWLRLFEASYGQNFKHVSAIVGAEAERVLRAAGALALTVDERTILFSQRLDSLSEIERLVVIGHELAHTIQFARGGTDALEDLEAEAWRASWAALSGEDYEIRGGARQETALAAVALVMDKEGEDYFKTFDRLEPLLVNKIEMIKPLTYEKILDIFLDTKFEKETDFVMQAHGTPAGFYISIVDQQGNNLKATARNLRELFKTAVLIAAFNAAGDDLAKLNAVIKKNLGSEAAPDVAAAKQTIQDAIAKGKSGCGVTKDEDVLRVSKKMVDVQKKERGTVELRTCNMGVSPDTLTFFREQFNANTLGAPDLYSAFGRCRPDLGPEAMRKFKTTYPQHAAMFPADKNEFGFTFDDPDPQFRVHTFSAAINLAAIQTFVSKSILGGKKFQPTDFPVHFLIFKSAIFPGDPMYKTRVKHATRPSP